MIDSMIQVINSFKNPKDEMGTTLTMNLGVLQLYLLPGAPDPKCKGLVALIIQYDKKVQITSGAV